MAASKNHTDKAAQNATIKVRLCPDDGKDELQNQLHLLAQEIVSSLSPLELSQSKELLGSFVSELFLSVAKQDQQDFRRRKQAEGIAAAKARGVRFGPSKKPLPETFDRYYQAWLEGRMTGVQAAAACGMTRHSFSRAAQQRKQAADPAG